MSKLSYPKFANSLQGYEIFDIKYKKVIEKWDALISLSETDVNEIINHSHLRFHTRNKEGWVNGRISVQPTARNIEQAMVKSSKF